jgi:hypothetical protein
MAISEASRHEMHVKLEEVLGAQVANTVMEHLPPVGWADVATKRDLDANQVLMKRDLEAQNVLMKRDLAAQTALLEGRFERIELQFRSELRGEINRLMLWQFPTMVTLLALAFAAAKLS